MKPFESHGKNMKDVYSFSHLKMRAHRIHADSRIIIQFYTLHSTCSSTFATRRGKGWRTCQYWRRFWRRFGSRKKIRWWWCGGFCIEMLCKVKLITLKSHDLLVTKLNRFQFTWGWLRLYISHSCGLITSSTTRDQVVFVVCGLEMSSHPPLTVAKAWRESYLPRNEKQITWKIDDKLMVGIWNMKFLLGVCYVGFREGHICTNRLGEDNSLPWG